MLHVFAFRRDVRAVCTAIVLAVSIAFAPVAVPLGHAVRIPTVPTLTPEEVRIQTRTRSRAPLTEEASMTRGEFVQAAVSALHIKNAAAGKTLRSAIQAIRGRRALIIFGTTPNWNASITRGEAASVLVKLTGIQTNDTRTFSDVHGRGAEQVAAAAITNGLLEPESTNLFGWRMPLTESEVQTLLQKAAALVPRQPVRILLPGAGDESREQMYIRETVLDLLQNEYLYQERLDGASEGGSDGIDGLVDSLHDPYTQYLPKVESENFQQQLRGSLEGIGANVEQTGGVLRIVTPLKGSPAEKSGLQPRDQILSADGVSLEGLPIDQAVGKIRGPKGTPVVLRIRRNGTEFDVTVIREKIEIPEVEVSMQGNIAIVKIFQFGELTESTLRRKMMELAEKNPAGIVLDLRSNPGGLLQTAGTTVSNFLPLGSVYVSIHSREGVEVEHTRQAPTISPDVPMVVLVNAGSASAAEIVAGALQDAARATIVGKQSFGKGTVQQVVQFTDGSSLKLTIAEWKTPLERKIDGVGITPDIVVESTSRTVDTQLERAIQRLRS